MERQVWEFGLPTGDADRDELGVHLPKIAPVTARAGHPHKHDGAHTQLLKPQTAGLGPPLDTGVRVGAEQQGDAIDAVPRSVGEGADESVGEGMNTAFIMAAVLIVILALGTTLRKTFARRLATAEYDRAGTEMDSLTTSKRTAHVQAAVDPECGNGVNAALWSPLCNDDGPEATAEGSTKKKKKKRGPSQAHGTGHGSGGGAATFLE